MTAEYAKHMAWHECLNPCFSGIYCDFTEYQRYKYVNNVLILVLVEYTVTSFFLTLYHYCHVLILVLVEYTVTLLVKRLNISLTVLILVLVEYTVTT